MTIKGLYEWAVENNVEEYELYVHAVKLLYLK